MVVCRAWLAAAAEGEEGGEVLGFGRRERSELRDLDDDDEISFDDAMCISGEAKILVNLGCLGFGLLILRDPQAVF